MRGHDDGVGGDDERRFTFGGVVDFGSVHSERFLGGGREHVFEGRQCFGQVLGEGGGDDFEVGEPYLCEELSAAW